MRLWVPFEVADLEPVRRFYTVHLGLSEVDSWERGAERGVVLQVPGPAFVELVQPAPGAPPAPRVALAFEAGSTAAVDAIGPGARFPRGHYGVTVTDPAGTPVLVWAER